jgi:hypothetical protein
VRGKKPLSALQKATNIKIASCIISLHANTHGTNVQEAFLKKLLEDSGTVF